MKYYQLLPEGHKLGKNTHLKLQVDYELGGISYFSGSSSARGYYLYIRPVQLGKEDSYITESFTLFGSGYKILLKQVARKSDKVYRELCQKLNLSELANQYLQGNHEIVKAMALK